MSINIVEIFEVLPKHFFTTSFATDNLNKFREFHEKVACLLKLYLVFKEDACCNEDLINLKVFVNISWALLAVLYEDLLLSKGHLLLIARFKLFEKISFLDNHNEMLGEKFKQIVNTVKYNFSSQWEKDKKEWNKHNLTPDCISGSIPQKFESSKIIV